jgi:DNA topoisomerase IB
MDVAAKLARALAKPLPPEVSPPEAAKLAKPRYVSDSALGITRHRRCKSFFYRDPDHALPGGPRRRRSGFRRPRPWA